MRAGKPAQRPPRRVVAFGGLRREDPGTRRGRAARVAAIAEQDAGELYAIYVLPQAWGSGAGAALMREAVAGLREAFDGDAVLWVLEDNPRARRFYEREGWRLDGGRKRDTFLGVEVGEVRYRLSAGAAGRA